jgi:hypothetical protein
MATSTDSPLGGLIAVSENSKVKALGYLTWFSIPDESVGLRKLKAALASVGLPASLAPKDTKAVKVFQRALREQEGRHRTNGHVIETTVAKVDETTEDMVYQVSRITRDLDDRVVDYLKAVRVIFNKRTEEVRFNILREVPQSVVGEITESIQEYIDKNASKISGARVRTVVRRYLRDTPDEQRGLEGLSGENLRGRSGGIYFVPAKHLDELKALQEALDDIYGGRGYLHAVPLADGKSERELVRRHHVANAKQEITEAINDVRGLLSADRDRAPRTDSVAFQWNKYHALLRRSAEYAEVLEDAQEEIEDLSDVLKTQLGKLLG